MTAALFLIVLLLAGLVALFGILILVRIDRLESRVGAIADRLREKAFSPQPAHPADTGAAQAAQAAQAAGRTENRSVPPAGCPDTAGLPARSAAGTSARSVSECRIATAAEEEKPLAAQPCAAEPPQAAAASRPETRPVGEIPSDRPHGPQAAPEMRTTPETRTAPEMRTARKRPQRNFEKYVGEKLFAKIGILVLIAGVGFFVKYAIESGWLSETVRTALGYAVAAALAATAYRLRDRYRSFGSLLAGGAFAAVFVTTAVAFHYYRLFPQPAAFAILIVSMLLTALAASVGNRRELATVALAGGYVAPFLVARGEGSHLFLFSYIAVLQGGMLLLSLRKRWWELSVVSFAATWLVVSLFTASRCTAAKAPDPTTLRDMFLFCTLFHLLFAVATVASFRTPSRKARTWLTVAVMLNGFVYLGFGLHFIRLLNPVHKVDGLLPLTIAAAYALAALRVRRRTDYPQLLGTLLPGMAVLFVTLAVPIQFEAGTLLLCWAAEAIVLLRLYIRTRSRIYDWGAAALCLLTVLYARELIGRGSAEHIFRSGETLAVLFAAGALGLAARITYRRRALFRQARAMRYTPVNALLTGAALLIGYAQVVREFLDYLSGDTLQQAVLLFTVGFAAAAGRALRRRFPMERFSPLYLIEAGAATLCYLVLSGNRGETPFTAVAPWLSTVVVALLLADVAARYYAAFARTARFTVYLNLLATIVWTTALCRMLHAAGAANSFGTGFSLGLMTAGAAQMLWGMRRRQKTLRLFALALFVLVLAKLLLHDLWQWPTVGRIAVFILSGVILLVLSFLYQRLKTVLFAEDEPDGTEK